MNETNILCKFLYQILISFIFISIVIKRICFFLKKLMTRTHVYEIVSKKNFFKLLRIFKIINKSYFFSIIFYCFFLYTINNFLSSQFQTPFLQFYCFPNLQKKEHNQTQCWLKWLTNFSLLEVFLFGYCTLSLSLSVSLPDKDNQHTLKIPNV